MMIFRTEFFCNQRSYSASLHAAVALTERSQVSTIRRDTRSDVLVDCADADCATKANSSEATKGALPIAAEARRANATSP